MKNTEKEVVGEFLRRFYDICATIESSNYTLDEFYQDFPEEMHSFLSEMSKNVKAR
tara:strand:- start:615 stop:782 length:168 start_codon:yes stop_codon:yes gene_type:complete